MFVINSINGSVQWLGVPDLLRTDGPPWTDNLLDHYASWGDRGCITNPYCGSQPWGEPNSVSITWNRPIRVLPIYHRRIFENMHTAVCHVRDNILQDNCTERMQSTSTCRNPIHSRQVNWQNDNWDDLWDEPVDQ